ncbi:hypothetical protein F2Q70_00029252 [Brassica cretica]|uniref:RNA helicase n=1 Tax=Brassica cretica TaxID=69181 RepID=A0A8S9H6L4_BRACR|nr:hypothetical protein F2Q70_00029252 [Brassica cretica]KAF2552474.1 hypothetical protein F2Q68_00033628 [Brassica cretica]
MDSPTRFAAQDYAAKYERIDVGDWESVGSSNSDDGLVISEIGISLEIVKALSRRGIQKPFPTQKVVLQPAMQGRARTGTEKTLAFGITVIDKIIKFNTKHGHGKNPLSFILTPTKDLARQVAKFKEALSLVRGTYNPVLIVEAGVFPVLVNLYVYENNKEVMMFAGRAITTNIVTAMVKMRSVDEAWAVLSNRISNLDAKAKIASQDRKSFAIGANLFIGNLDYCIYDILVIMRNLGFGFISYDSFDASDAGTECREYTTIKNADFVSCSDETKEKIRASVKQFWAERSRIKRLKERLTSFWSEIVSEAAIEEGSCEL